MVSRKVSQHLVVHIDPASFMREVFLVSPDSRRVAYVARTYRWLKPPGWYVVADGERGEEHEAIREGSLTFSADSRRLGYAVQHGAGQAVIVDNERSEPHQAVGQGPAFDAEGRRYAYAARTGEHWQVVVDGAAGPSFDGISPGSIVWGTAGGSLFYGARTGDRYFAVKDHVPQLALDALGVDWVPSPDGRTLAYTARSGGDWSVMVDRRKGAAYDSVLRGSLTFGAAVDHLGYAARRGTRCQVVVNEAHVACCDEVSRGPLFSADGSRSAWICTNDGGRSWQVTVDGDIGPAWEQIPPQTLRFSADGSRVGYAARHGGQWFLVTDGGEQGPYAALGSGPVFSADGRRCAYVAGNAKQQWVVVDGVAGTRYAGIARGTLAFSPDGRHVVYGAMTRRGQIAVVDEVPGTPFDSIVQRGGGRIVFDSSTAWHYLAIRGTGIYCVEECLI